MKRWISRACIALSLAAAGSAQAGPHSYFLTEFQGLPNTPYPGVSDLNKASQLDRIETKEQDLATIVDTGSTHQQRVGRNLRTQQHRKINNLSLIPQYGMTARETRAVAWVVVRITDDCSGCIDTISAPARESRRHS